MIGKKELTGVLITVIVVKMLLAYPRELVTVSGQAAWIQVIYVSLVALALILVSNQVYAHKQSVMELAHMVGGKGLRIAVGIIIFLILLANFSTVARVFPETVKIVLLQNFNADIILMVFAVAAAIGAYMGIRSVSRVNYMFLPIAGGVFIGFLLLLMPYYKINNITPILGEGADKIFLSGFNALSLFSDIILLNVLLPYSKNLSEAKTVSIRTIIISSIVALLIIAAYCLAYAYPVSQDYILPVYQMSRMIHISSFFSRFESFFQFIWSILILLYASIYIYAMCGVLQRTFDLKYINPLILPVTILGITIAGIPSSVTNAIQLEKYVNLVEYPIVFLLPIILGLLTRNKGGVRNETD